MKRKAEVNSSKKGARIRDTSGPAKPNPRKSDARKKTKSRVLFHKSKRRKRKEETSQPVVVQQPGQAGAPRKRGRPRKYPLPLVQGQSNSRGLTAGEAGQLGEAIRRFMGTSRINSGMRLLGSLDELTRYLRASIKFGTLGISHLPDARVVVEEGRAVLRVEKGRRAA